MDGNGIVINSRFNRNLFISQNNLLFITTGAHQTFFSIRFKKKKKLLGKMNLDLISFLQEK